MKRRIATALLVFAALVGISGCGGQPKSYSAQITPSLTVTGDVGQELQLSSYAGYKTAQIKVNDKTVTALPFWQLLDAAGLVGDDAMIYLSAPDGIISGIPASELKADCYLYMGSENGWQFVSEKLPPQCGVKRMDKIVVCAKTLKNEQRCLRIIADDQYLTLSYGELFMADADAFAVHEADPKKYDATVSVNTRRSLIPISAYAAQLHKTGASKVLAYFGDGSQKEVSLSGYIEWRGASCDYIGEDKIARSPDLIGLWLDPPQKSITDIAANALAALSNGRVLMVELDGLGYSDLVTLSPPFLSQFNIAPARTVMPCVSSVALAALMSGLPGVQNGIVKEGVRQFKSGITDLPAQVKKLGKSCTVVEGDTTLIELSVSQELNPDANKDGSTDDEVFASAKKALASGLDFTFVHFHGYDDVSHTYGPMSSQASAELKALDSYLSELCSQFTGTLIVTADHGQYSVAAGGKLGEHGEFRPSSMTIPIIQTKVVSKP